MTLNPSLSWLPLDNVFYRDRTCYDNLNLPLDNAHVSIGPYVSAIALYNTATATTTSNSIDIFLPSGLPLFSIPWNVSLHPISNIGWSPSGHLIVVLKSGKFRVYYNYNGDFNEFDLGLPIKSTIFNNSGFAIQSLNNRFLYIPNYNTANVITFNLLETSNSIDPFHISSWCISSIPDLSITSINSIKLFIATSNGICIINKHTTTPNFLLSSTLNSIDLIDISPNQNFIALSSSSLSSLFIYDIDFQNLLLDYKLTQPPSQLSWCSNDVVILSYASSLLIIGPSKSTLKINTYSKPYLYNQIDGLYYLTSTNLNFFSKVSENTESTFKIGSTSSSALLLDSINYSNKFSLNSINLIKLIDQNLVYAIDTCIRCATEEFDVYWQKILLKSANFGITKIIDLYSTTEFIQSCNYLRILNLIRGKEIGLFLTFNQLLNLGIENLIDLLLLKNLHYLSLKITKSLNLTNLNSKILVNWANLKIKKNKNLNDDELFDIIMSKLGNDTKRINWLQISKTAYLEGRLSLSKNLSVYELNNFKKISFLLDLNMDLNYPISKANDDSLLDGILLIMFTVWNDTNQNVSDFLKLINNNPAFTGILKSFFYTIHKGLLNSTVYLDDDLFGQLIIAIKTKDHKRVKLLVNSGNNRQFRYLKSVNPTHEEGDNDNDDDDGLLHTSPIIKLQDLIKSDLKQAIKSYPKLKIPKFQFVSTVLSTLAPIKSKHLELYEFSNTSLGKIISPDVYFYKFLKLREKRQAAMYVKLCTKNNYKWRVKMFCLCGMVEDAKSEATKMNDSILVDELKRVYQ